MLGAPTPYMKYPMGSSLSLYSPTPENHPFREHPTLPTSTKQKMADSFTRPPNHVLLPWMTPKSSTWCLLDTRGRHLFKLAVIAFVCVILGYTISNLHSSNPSSLSNHSFSLPASISLGSWASPFVVGLHGSSENKSNNNTNTTTTSFPNPPKTTTLSQETNTTLSRLEEEAENPNLPNEELRQPDRVFLGEQTRIGKVTILFGGDNPTYERALRTHDVHNRIHGYPMNVLRQGILNDVWTKPAYILSLLLRELSKPKGQRLEWLL